MTEPNSSAGEAVPITLDAVASHLRRRTMQSEQEALMLSIAVRDLDLALRAEQAETARLRERIAELEAANG